MIQKGLSHCKIMFYENHSECGKKVYFPCVSQVFLSISQFKRLVVLVVLRIYVALAVFHPYRDLEAGDNQSLKFKWRGGESNPGPLAPQTKSLTNRQPPLQKGEVVSVFLACND